MAIPRTDADAAMLRARLVEPGWTPGARDLGGLFALLVAAGDGDAAGIERALVRRADLAGPRAIAELGPAAPAGRVRLLRLLGRLVSAGGAPAEAAAAALAHLGDDAAAVRRQAARALAAFRTPPPEVEGALVAALAGEARPEVRRALVDALGKIGGPAASAALAAASAASLAAVPPADDVPADAAASRARLDAAGLARARLAAERPGHRAALSEIDLAAALPGPVEVILHCRRGLAPLVAAELADHRPRILDGARVAVRSRRPLARLAGSRLLLRLGLPLPVEARADGDAAAAIAAALTRPAARALFAALTRGAIRYRLEWSDGRHRRALTHAVAAQVAAAAPELINDPVDATWQVHLTFGRVLRLELEPRRAGDVRFAYRVKDVPAASHPTLAAALARLAVAHSAAPAADVVWDPFVGSGLELVERARAAPVAALHGTDLDDDALAAAAANLVAAGVAATLLHADATVHEIAGLTSIITNPPMGRRVARGEAKALLAGFIDHAARALVPGGVMVWISPFPRDTRARADARGLVLREAHLVDMGGFDGEIQVLASRPATP